MLARADGIHEMKTIRALVSPSTRIFTLFAVLLGLAVLLSSLIVGERYAYLAGAVFAVLFFFVVFVKKRFEVGIVLSLVVITFWEGGLRGGWWDFFGFAIGHGTLALLAVALVYFIDRHAQQRPAVVTGRTKHQRLVGWLLAFYLIALLASSIGQEDRVTGLIRWVEFGARGCLGFALMSRILKTSTDIRWFLFSLLGLAAVISLSDNANLLFGKPLIPFSLGWMESDLTVTVNTRFGLQTEYIRSAFGSPAYGGAFYASMLPLAIWLVRSSRFVVLRLLGMLLVISIATNLFHLLERSSWLAAAVSLAVLWMFVRSRRARFFLLVVAIALAFFSFALVLLGYVRLPSQLVVSAPTVLDSERYGIWSNVFNALPHYPLLLGMGFRNTDGFMSITDRYGTSSLGYWQPHNYYIELLVDAGILVLTLFVAIVAHVLWRGFRAIKEVSCDFNRECLVATTAGMAGFSVAMLFDGILIIPSLHSYYFVYAGTVYALATHFRIGPVAGDDGSGARNQLKQIGTKV